MKVYQMTIKPIFLTFVGVFLTACTICLAQVSTPDSSGITGVRDSNFPRVGELTRMRKQYPDIQLVAEPEVSPRIRRDVVDREVDGISLAGAIYHSEDLGKRVIGVLVIHGGGWRRADTANLDGWTYGE